MIETCELNPLSSGGIAKDQWIQSWLNGIFWSGKDVGKGSHPISVLNMSRFWSILGSFTSPWITCHLQTHPLHHTPNKIKARVSCQIFLKSGCSYKKGISPMTCPEYIHFSVWHLASQKDGHQNGATSTNHPQRKEKARTLDFSEGYISHEKNL